MQLEHEHTSEAIAMRLAAEPRHSYLRDAVYGGIDGAVTTFAIVSGVVGGALGPRVILILGAANLIADGFSMAAANFSGTRSEVEEMRSIRDREERHIRIDPEGEREEVRQIYEKKGFSGAGLEHVVDVLTSDRERWIATMLAEEYGLPREIRSPLRAAAITFAAFGVCGLVPLLPYLAGTNSFSLSISLTVLVLFFIGALKSRWSTIPWWRSSLETMSLGSAAAALSYLIAQGLRAAFGVQ